MRLIDADKLVSELLGEWVEDFDKFGESEMVSATEQIAEHIKSLETVDAEPVVRCKDCKYFVEIKVVGRTVRDCGRLSPYGGFAVSRNDFCSFGRRKR